MLLNPTTTPLESSRRLARAFHRHVRRDLRNVFEFEYHPPKKKSTPYEKSTGATDGKKSKPRVSEIFIPRKKGACRRYTFSDGTHLCCRRCRRRCWPTSRPAPAAHTTPNSWATVVPCPWSRRSPRGHVSAGHVYFRHDQSQTQTTKMLRAAPSLLSARILPAAVTGRSTLTHGARRPEEFREQREERTGGGANGARADSGPGITARRSQPPSHSANFYLPIFTSDENTISYFCSCLMVVLDWKSEFEFCWWRVPKISSKIEWYNIYGIICIAISK